MPSSPELGDTARDEGIVEVLKEVKAEYFTQTYGHIRIAREVKVDLQGECHGIHPIEEYRFLIRCSELITQRSHSIRYKHLL